jgi:hypothetical protein
MVVIFPMKDFMKILLLKILILFRHLSLKILLMKLQKARLKAVFLLKMQQLIFQTVILLILTSIVKPWVR